MSSLGSVKSCYSQTYGAPALSSPPIEALPGVVNCGGVSSSVHSLDQAQMISTVRDRSISPSPTAVDSFSSLGLAPMQVRIVTESESSNSPIKPCVVIHKSPVTSSPQSPPKSSTLSVPVATRRVVSVSGPSVSSNDPLAKRMISKSEVELRNQEVAELNKGRKTPIGQKQVSYLCTNLKQWNALPKSILDLTQDSAPDFAVNMTVTIVPLKVPKCLAPPTIAALPSVKQMEDEDQIGCFFLNPNLIYREKELNNPEDRAKVNKAQKKYKDDLIEFAKEKKAREKRKEALDKKFERDLEPIAKTRKAVNKELDKEKVVLDKKYKRDLKALTTARKEEIDQEYQRGLEIIQNKREEANKEAAALGKKYRIARDALMQEERDKKAKIEREYRSALESASSNEYIRRLNILGTEKIKESIDSDQISNRQFSVLNTNFDRAYYYSITDRRSLLEFLDEIPRYEGLLNGNYLQVNVLYHLPETERVKPLIAFSLDREARQFVTRYETELGQIRSFLEGIKENSEDIRDDNGLLDLCRYLQENYNIKSTSKGSRFKERLASWANRAFLREGERAAILNDLSANAGNFILKDDTCCGYQVHREWRVLSSGSVRKHSEFINMQMREQRLKMQKEIGRRKGCGVVNWSVDVQCNVNSLPFFQRGLSPFIVDLYISLDARRKREKQLQGEIAHLEWELGEVQERMKQQAEGGKVSVASKTLELQSRTGESLSSSIQRKASIESLTSDVDLSIIRSPSSPIQRQASLASRRVMPLIDYTSTIMGKVNSGDELLQAIYTRREELKPIKEEIQRLEKPFRRSALIHLEAAEKVEMFAIAFRAQAATKKYQKSILKGTQSIRSMIEAGKKKEKYKNIKLSWIDQRLHSLNDNSGIFARVLQFLTSDQVDARSGWIEDQRYFDRIQIRLDQRVTEIRKEVRKIMHLQ